MTLTSLRSSALELVRFGIVGVLTNLISLAIYGIGIWIGLHFALASLVAVLGSITVSFVANGRYVFRREGSLKKFAALYTTAYLIQTGAIWFFSTIGVNLYISAVLALPVLALLSFLVQRRFVFLVPDAGPSVSATEGIEDV